LVVKIASVTINFKKISPSKLKEGIKDIDTIKVGKELTSKQIHISLLQKNISLNMLLKKEKLIESCIYQTGSKFFNN